MLLRRGDRRTCAKHLARVGELVLARNGIPVLFFFNGVHEDYHEPSDTFDKINFEKLSKIIKLSFAVGWKVANLPGPLERKPLVP
ncbi:MAG: M28 family peptidase [Chlorobiales bacterium]|nr:M28 family peptidase [Chlorobiales bacterium]